MNKQTIIPLGDRILIKPLSEDKKTKGGIILPDTISKERPEQGKVIAVGDGRITDEGKRVPMSVKKGDTVIFAKYGPDEIKVGDEEYLIVREDSILAIIK